MVSREAVIDTWLPVGGRRCGGIRPAPAHYSWDEHGSGRNWHAVTAVLALAPYSAAAVLIAL